MNDNYKKTKLGWIPKEWEVVKLEKLLDLLTDFESNGSFASVKENVTIFDEYEFSWYVRATDLENDTPLSKVKYVDEKSYKFLRKTKLFGGEVLLTKRGEIGKVYFFEKPTNVNATLAPNLYLLKINDLLINKYLYYYFLSSLGQKRLKRINASATIGALYKNDVKKLQIPLPPLPEQKKIAKILSTVDAKINNLSDQITETEMLKKGLMQQLLTEGIGHSEFKDSKLGRIPKSWEVRKIEDFLIEYRGGAALKPADFVDNKGFYVIPKKSITHGGKMQLNFEKPKMCTFSFADNNQNNIIDNSYLVTTLRDLVPSGPNIGYIVKFDFENQFILSQGVYGFKINENLDSDFLIQYSNTISFRKIMQTIMVGSTQVHIRNSEYFNVPIPFPPLSEQKEIAKILSTVDAKLAVLRASREEYGILKKGMMQVLLTGEVRVN